MVIFMKCPHCGSEVSDDWGYCPNCGDRLNKKKDLMDLSDVFDGMQKELDQMNNIFEKNLEVFDIRPFFKQPLKGKGFTIKIVNKNGQKPEVSVKTFGDVDAKAVEQTLSKYIGQERPSRTPISQNVQQKVPTEPPKITEEPATNVRRMGDSVVIEVKLPGVKSMGDVRVQDLESSVEVRARAGDKAYFKILTKPETFRLADTKFSDELLFLEFK